MLLFDNVASYWLRHFQNRYPSDIGPKHLWPYIAYEENRRVPNTISIYITFMQSRGVSQVKANY